MRTLGRSNVNNIVLHSRLFYAILIPSKNKENKDEMPITYTSKHALIQTLLNANHFMKSLNVNQIYSNE